MPSPPSPLVLVLSLAVIAAAAYAVLRKVDVRLALFLAALALGGLAGAREFASGNPDWALLPVAVVRTFVATISKEQYVVPICCAMGFAYVLRHTECDQHLVQLLVRPLRRMRAVVIPGAVVVGFLVNVPVISQTSTAVAVGAVLVPLMRAAGVSPVTTGAALLLGASVGGELLNPGAPELQTVSRALGVGAAECVRRVWPLALVQLGVATAVFWAFSARAEAKYRQEHPDDEKAEDDAPAFRVNPLKAAVPLLPLVLLFVAAPPLELVQVPREWLLDAKELKAESSPFDSRLIGAAMVLGAAAAALTSPRSVGGSAKAFFDGAGYALTHIISLIVISSCFGEGVKQTGLAALLGEAIGRMPGALLPAAAGLPLAFAALSGSGMAATQSLYEFFVAPAESVGIDPMHVGAVVSLGAAAGRTMSPVAAVCLMCARQTETDPFTLSRRVAGPLLIGMAVVVVVAVVMA